MKKKDYAEIMNEIEVDNKLKQETLSKIKQKKSYTKRIYTVASALIVFVIAISIAIPLNNNKNKETPIVAVEKNNGLPKVENFETLYNILKNRKNNYYETVDVLDITSNATEDNVKSPGSLGTTKENVSNDGSDYSKTNIQVEGVDEADIVKTDGDYIYYSAGNKLVIVNASDPTKLQIVSEIEYEKENIKSAEIFINNNKLVIIGQKRVYEANQNKEVYYDLDLVYRSPDLYTIAKVYNIENKENPQYEREVQIEGDYLSSRMIGENIYFMANKYIYCNLPEEYTKENVNEDEYKPKYLDTSISEKLNCKEFTDIYYFPDSEENSYLNIAGFNINNNEPANIESYLGAGEEIYSSENNLYITKVKYEYKNNIFYGYYDNYDVDTYIYKFKLEDSKIVYTNVGSVPGEVLNQFSMDEKDGYFRIATTDSNNWNSDTDTNNMYVLNEKLEVVGKIENLAKGEKIYSVRFMGNRAYMVTFVQTDPLFVIDLSEPTNPVVLGELKIPGYSKYLHPYDETHIIGFGENTTTNKYGGVVTDGMKMALFDVSNPSNPKELYSVDIGEKGTYSEILNNHKALLFSKEKNIIAFPISIREEEGEYNSKLTFQGAIVYGLDLNEGFTLKGTIAHMQIEDDEYTDYNYTKEVERIIYIRDSLYTLSEGLVKSTNIETMQEQSSLEL